MVFGHIGKFISGGGLHRSIGKAGAFFSRGIGKVHQGLAFGRKIHTEVSKAVPVISGLVKDIEQASGKQGGSKILAKVESGLKGADSFLSQADHLANKVGTIGNDALDRYNRTFG